jgi:hypothetical protein
MRRRVVLKWGTVVLNASGVKPSNRQERADILTKLEEQVKAPSPDERARLPTSGPASLP